MNFACIFFGILFIVAGILFSLGKVHIHLTAWKNMSQQEKNKIRIQPLCRNIGAVITLSGILFLINGVWTGFGNRLFLVSMVTWLFLAGLDVLYISKSSRYYRK